MAGDKHMLIDLLLEVAATRLEPSSARETAELIRAAFLVNSSNSPEACTRVDAIEYATSGDRQGLMVGGKLLSDVFEALARCTAPSGLVEREPDLTPEDWQAAMRVISRILAAFEYPPSGSNPPAPDPTD